MTSSTSCLTVGHRWAAQVHIQAWTPVQNQVPHQLLAQMPCTPLSPHACVSQMRLMALDIIKGLTASPDGIDKLKAKVDKLLVFVLRLVPVPDPQPQAVQLSEGALISLVNLSQDTDCANKMVAAKTIGRVMDYLREGVCPHHRLMVRG